MVSQINSSSDVTGIKAYTSGKGAIILQKIDGNDIIIKNVVTANASTLSTRQIDEFGEVITTAAQGIPVTVSTGNYIVSGGQIKGKKHRKKDNKSYEVVLSSLFNDRGVYTCTQLYAGLTRPL